MSSWYSRFLLFYFLGFILQSYSGDRVVAAGHLRISLLLVFFLSPVLDRMGQLLWTSRCSVCLMAVQHVYRRG